MDVKLTSTDIANFNNINNVGVLKLIIDKLIADKNELLLRNKHLESALKNSESSSVIDNINKTMCSISDEVEDDFVDLGEELKFCRA